MKMILIGLLSLFSISAFANIIQSADSLYVVSTDGQMHEVTDSISGTKIKAKDVNFKSGYLLESKLNGMLFIVNQTNGKINAVYADGGGYLRGSTVTVHK